MGESIQSGQGTDSNTKLTHNEMTNGYIGRDSRAASRTVHFLEYGNERKTDEKVPQTSVCGNNRV